MKFKELNLRKWEYKGEKLVNPILILWRLTLFPVYKLSLLLTCLLALVIFGKYAAKEIWDIGQ